jgi:protein-L-isoaspartate(D-aspartate) O-methyltransferase
VTGSGEASPDEVAAHARGLISTIALRTPYRSEKWDPRVLSAVQAVPRHRFVPELPLDEAYRDAPALIGSGQTMSQPTVVAMMTQALALGADRAHRVLEIGTGSGYQAAVLSALAKEVVSVEVRPELAARARAKLAELGCANVRVVDADGYAPGQGTFARIIVTAAPPALPAALVEALEPGGILVAPVGPEGATQRLLRVTKGDAGAVTIDDLGGVIFVPMVHGA